MPENPQSPPLTNEELAESFDTCTPPKPAEQTPETLRPHTLTPEGK